MVRLSKENTLKLMQAKEVLEQLFNTIKDADQSYEVYSAFVELDDVIRDFGGKVND